MWLFQSIFGSDATACSYPETLIKAAIERAVDGTDPWIRAVSGYKRKLRPAVVMSIDHVMALVDGMAPPIVLEPGSYGSDPRLRTFFISNEEMRKVLDNDRNLADFRRGQAVVLPHVTALLVMKKQEQVFFGAELSGDIVLRDVPQVTVSFEAHRLIDPAGSEEETRRQLRRRAFDHLLSLALWQIAIVKTERDKLERYRALLQSKLNLLQRGSWGFNETAADEHPDVVDIEEQLDKIEMQLLELGGDDRMLEVYLGIVTDVLGRPEKHLWARKETLILDRRGIKRSEAADDAPEVTLDLMCDSEGRSMVVSLVATEVETIRDDDRA